MTTEDPRNVEVTLTLTRPQALALAQFVKRTGHSHCEELATNENQAYLMMEGVNEIMRALAEEGFNPR
ncbi:hypothetical protein DOC35_19455 [Salmonella enterica subsp. enterica]|nr:hypothetical protein [Salmonella enterica subsp. enterica]